MESEGEAARNTDSAEVSPGPRDVLQELLPQRLGNAAGQPQCGPQKLVPLGPQAPGQGVAAGEGPATVGSPAFTGEAPIFVIKGPVVVGGLFAFSDLADHYVKTLPRVQYIGAAGVVHVDRVAAGGDHRAVFYGVGVEKQPLPPAGGQPPKRLL